MTTQVQFGFTPAECEVWTLRFLGHTPDMISSILNIERAAVESHLQQCLVKCQHHIAGGEDLQKKRGIEGNPKKGVRTQSTQTPVVFAPVPEFAAFYL